MQVLRAADEPDRGHAIAVVIHGALGRFDQRRMVGQPKIVVGAQVDHLIPAHHHTPTLWRGDQAFAFVQALILDLGQGGAQAVQESLGHRGLRFPSA